MDSNFLMSLALIFSSSIAGSFHCGSMCGSFACIVSNKDRCKTKLLKNSFFYHFGRLITYSSLTLVFFYGANSIEKFSGADFIKNFALYICIAILLIDLMIDLPFVKKFSVLNNLLTKNSNLYRKLIYRGSSYLGKISNAYNSRKSNTSAYLIGATSGLIPCSWLYIYITMAGSQETIGRALMLITTFWLGTIPILVLVGNFGSLLAKSIFPQIKYLSRVILIVAALISINSRAPIFSSNENVSCHSSGHH